MEDFYDAEDGDWDGECEFCCEICGEEDCVNDSCIHD